jgi:hypothetical protein
LDEWRRSCCHSEALKATTGRSRVRSSFVKLLPFSPQLFLR